MRKKSVVFLSIILLLFQSSFAFAAQEINVKVKGLVCAFCARNIEKSLLKNDSVQKVKGNLDSKIVTINLKEGKSLTDESIKEIIIAAGYNVSEIKR